MNSSAHMLTFGDFGCVGETPLGRLLWGWWEVVEAHFTERGWFTIPSIC